MKDNKEILQLSKLQDFFIDIIEVEYGIAWPLITKTWFGIFFDGTIHIHFYVKKIYQQNGLLYGAGLQRDDY